MVVYFYVKLLTKERTGRSKTLNSIKEFVPKMSQKNLKPKKRVIRHGIRSTSGPKMYIFG